MASETVDPNSLEAYTTCRLIPLNKNPGVRPIGVGQTLRRIIGKTLGWVLKEYIQVIAGPLQSSHVLLRPEYVFNANKPAEQQKCETSVAC